MINLTIKQGLHLVAGGALLMFANLSHAQFVWIDAKGMKQFSDRPPPPGTPVKNILKAKNMATASEAAAAPAAPAAPTSDLAPAKAAPTSVADREADYRKRKTEQAELEKKAGDEAANARIKKEACSAARQNKTVIDTGAPIRDTDAERSWLSDQQRAQRKAAAEKAISDHCI